MKLFFGYSPCPNDTYMFGPIAKGIISIEGDDIIPVIRDVETLNFMALGSLLDISKLSFYAYFKVKESYELLLNGGAMGFGCGPVLISKKKIYKKEIHKSRIVFPGELTTAHLLFRLWEPCAIKRIFTTYDKIFYFLDNDLADCGVIIHESRFTFKNCGYQLIVDLGSWWEEKTGLPVPLGCIAAKKTMGKRRLHDIEDMLYSSLKKVNSSPQEFYPYVRKYAQELSYNVLSKHINTFVNQFSFGFGSIGLRAIEKLYSKACKIGVLK